MKSHPNPLKIPQTIIEKLDLKNNNIVMAPIKGRFF